jgi:hypothetical protein
VLNPHPNISLHSRELRVKPQWEPDLAHSVQAQGAGLICSVIFSLLLTKYFNLVTGNPHSFPILLSVEEINLNSLPTFAFVYI